MEASADEDARINSKSLHTEEAVALGRRKSQGSFKNNSSHRTGSSMLQQTRIAKPMTSQQHQRTKAASFMVAPDTMRGTFSRAGGPRLKQPNDVMDRLTNRSLYQQITVQNVEANRNNDLPKKYRAAISQSFKSAQKSFSHCNMLNEASKIGRSMLDIDFNKVGKVEVATRTAVFTNDPGLHRGDMINSQRATHRTERQLTYRYGDDIIKESLATTSNLFKASKAMNHENKVHYGKCLDAKGGSQVYIADKDPAGAVKIQTKAYRANTQT